MVAGLVTSTHPNEAERSTAKSPIGSQRRHHGFTPLRIHTPCTHPCPSVHQPYCSRSNHIINYTAHYVHYLEPTTQPPPTLGSGRIFSSFVHQAIPLLLHSFRQPASQPVHPQTARPSNSPRSMAAAMARTTAKRPLRILCFGDSLTSGYHHFGLDSHPYSLRLTKLLREALPDKSLDIVTSGVPGDGVVFPRFEQRMRNECEFWASSYGGGAERERGPVARDRHLDQICDTWWIQRANDIGGVQATSATLTG